jgi:hypothetical protein
LQWSLDWCANEILVEFRSSFYRRPIKLPMVSEWSTLEQGLRSRCRIEWILGEINNLSATNDFRVFEPTLGVFQQCSSQRHAKIHFLEGFLRRSNADRHFSDQWPCQLEMDLEQLSEFTAAFHRSIGHSYDV